MWIFEDRLDLPHASCFKDHEVYAINSAQIHVALTFIC